MRTIWDQKEVTVTASYRVLCEHVSEFPVPLQLLAGERVRIIERYQGSEDWRGWLLCAHSEGGTLYIPEQILAREGGEGATLMEPYTNRELNVGRGEVLRGSIRLNGWLWAYRAADESWGWVPLSCLAELE